MRALPSRALDTVRSLPWRWIGFPLAVLFVFTVLVGLNLNGSSIALDTSADPAPGLIAGKPRPIRSDEFLIDTPLAISDVRQGFPKDPWIGLSRADQSALAHGAPTAELPTFFRPQIWGYLFGGAGIGLAVSWWLGYAICLWGLFALVGLITRKPLLSAGLAVVGTFTPYTGWWTASQSELILGYSALAAAGLIAAWTVTRRWVAAAFSVASGLIGVALVLTLYPPWQVSVGLVLLALCVGYAVDQKVPLWRFAGTIAGAAVIAGPILGVWYLQNHDAISAQTSTIYPGHRVTVAGTAALSSVIDAPLNFWMAGDAGRTLGTAGRDGVSTNPSEASSTWIALPVLLLAVLGALELAVRRWRRGPPEDPDPQPTSTWGLGLVSLMTLLLLGWAFVSLPDVIGSLTLLRRVQPERVPLALGVAQIVLVALAVRHRGSRPVVWSWPFLAAAAVATAFSVLYADRHLSWDDGATPWLLVLASGAFVGAALAAAMHRRTAGAAMALLAVFAMVSWSTINPLQHGVRPLVEDSVVRALASASKDSGNPRVMVFSKDPGTGLSLVAKARAAGLQSLSGTTIYPDRALMTSLAPDQESLWNNYVNYVWAPVPESTPARIVQLRGTLMRLDISPCDPVLLRGTRPGWVLSEIPLTASCLTQVDHLARHRGVVDKAVWIYRIDGTR